MAGLRQFTPPSMKGLNFNIDADLDLGATHGIKTDYLQTSTLINPLTLKRGANVMALDVDNSAIAFHGGTITANHGAEIMLCGTSYNSGRIEFSVPGSAFVQLVMKISGNTDTPFLDLMSHRIASIADPTTAQDALTFKTWSTYTPTITWTGGTPSGITSAARWVQIGKIVYYIVNIFSADSNGCTNVTITTPSTAANTGVYYQGTCIEHYGVAGNTWKDPGALVAANTNLIVFWDFGAATDNQLIHLFISGWYEVA